MIPVRQNGNQQVMAARLNWDDIMNYIQKYWDQDYYITDFVYGNGVYCVVMTKKCGYNGQVIRAGKTFPREKIEEKWNEGYRITSVLYDGTDWVVVMSDGDTGIGAQTWFTRGNWENFKSEIQKAWNEDYLLTNVSYGDVTYCGIMSKGMNWSQSWKLVGGSLTQRDLDNIYSDSGIIVCLMNCAQGFFYVKSSYTPYRHQVFYKSSSWDPINNKMHEYWDKGYIITSFCFYKGEWILLMSKPR
ncbi:MAG: hypothetical protein IJ776_02165 [Paludibacteraceae bacterium]|nr:hypothetical protein [Paludibacteraceae bacterium]